MLSRSIAVSGLAALFAAAMSAIPAPVSAQDDKVMLIVDSSRSMWGHIDGVNKVVHARKALERVFKRNRETFQLGLMAYGHQKKAGCDDFGVLKPVGGIDAKGYARAVNGIAPKGSTPLAAALDAASDEMVKEGGAKHIVLMSDGLDNCDGDPCAVAEKLARSVPQMTLHTIAFDKADERATLEKLSCVSSPSGGVFKTATSREELDAAFDAIAARISAPPKRPDNPPRTAMPDADPDAPVPIKLTAYISGDEERINRNLVWRIFAGRAGDDGRYELFHEFRKAQPTVELKPGAYFVHVSWGMAHSTKRLEVAPGQPAHEQVVVKAGAIRLNARQTSGAPVDMDEARFDIYTEETDQFGKRKRIMSDAPAGPVIRLNTGEYYVVSTYGDGNAVVESKIEVKPGKLSEVILIHDASKVTFRLVERRGGEAIADTRWTVTTAKGNVVKKSAGAFPTHILTSGKYKVEAEHGGRSFTRSFELAGGGSKQVEVLMR